MQAKALLKSTTVWGLIGIMVPYLDHLYQYAASIPDGVLPEGVNLIVSGLGWLVALYGRTVATKPLSLT